MSEEVKKGNVSPQDIIAQVKEQKSFGPFNNEYSKCERSSSAGWVQWQNIKAENIYFHYEIIIGERTIDQNKNTNKIYSEFHIEPNNTNCLIEKIGSAVKNLEHISCNDQWHAKKGLAIRYDDGVDVIDPEAKDNLSKQMTNLYNAINGVICQNLIKYCFNPLFNNSSNANDFLLALNKAFLRIYYGDKKKGNASAVLIGILQKIFKEKAWAMTLGSKVAKDSLGVATDSINIGTFIAKVAEKGFLISPFTFWSTFFAYNNANAKKQRKDILAALITHLYKQDDKLTDNLKKFRENQGELTIEHWLQNISELSNYNNICWELFNKLMTIDLDNSNENWDDINTAISKIVKNSERTGDNKETNGVMIAGIQNILPFIRPDLKFEFNGEKIMNIIKSADVVKKETCELLENSKQIILTGAPGTGKTYLATEVAEKMIKDARTAEEKAKIAEDAEAKLAEEKKKLAEEEEKNYLEKYKEKLTEEEKKLFQKVQFHPGYDYSDFITGLKPEVKGDKVTFEWKDGVFKKFSDKALKAYIEANAKGEKVKPYIFIIDEINRADLSRVFGEVFSLLEENYRFEYDKNGAKLYELEFAEDVKDTQEVKKEKVEVKGKGTPITLPSKANFILPPNLYIIGTMNDIDRSVESMDFALRRRFSWKEVTAEESAHIIDAKDKEDKEKIEKPEHREALKRAMKALNNHIGGAELNIGTQDKTQNVSLNLGTEYQLGGAYFLNFTKYQKESNPFESLWNNHIAIILNEYLRGRSNRQDIVSALKKVYDNALTGKSNADNAKSADDKKGTPAPETAPDGANQ